LHGASATRREANMKLQRIGRLLHRCAEAILAAMLAVMFLAFIVQIVFRYLLGLPTGWTSELTVIMWIWLVLWGSAFVLRNDEEIRFDLIYGAAGRRTRRVMAALSALALIGLYLFSLPAVVDYVTFMKVQASSYLKIRFDLLYSIYVLFAVAAIARFARILWKALSGNDEAGPRPAAPGSGL
jgi:TRAP-type C4-dicarboxylate transport system permease small subunit